MTRMLEADRLLTGVAGAVCVIATATTATWCASMSAMGMPMPGGWTMSMAWMRMPGQTWPGAAAAFLGMWIVMMVAMMLPSLVPMLAAYRRALAGDARRPVGWLTLVTAGGYFAVWTLVGAAVYPVGVVMAAVEMQHPGLARLVPAAVAVVVLLAGLVQWTAWKASWLACCHTSARSSVPVLTGLAAWRLGVALGLDCAMCCANLMTLMLVLGVMEPTVMVLVTAAITVERLAPADLPLPQATGVAITGCGIVMLAGAVVGP